MEFKASLDTMAKIVTICFTLTFAVILVIPFVNGEAFFDSYIYTSAIILLVYIPCYLYSPRRYSITLDLLIIHRAIGDVTIRKQDIKNIEILEKGPPFSVRTFAVGGLFGYFGTFYNFDRGNMTWYVTRRDRAVLITTKRRKIVLSPDEVVEFVRQLRPN